MFIKKESLIKLRDKLILSLKSCNLCPRKCGVNRLLDQKGYCRVGRFAKVNSAFLHFGEEKELVGRGGSGTIFFSFCNLGCIYCQNYQLSHYGEGKEVDSEELSKMILSLQEIGAENINFVTPTHCVPQIIESLVDIYDKLNIPLVYNCGGYENVEIIKLLEGVFDIYMPDIKYSDNLLGEKYSGVKDYWDVVKSCVKEMYRQVGDLYIEGGIAKKGLLIRHLVLPNLKDNSFKVLDFIKDNLSSSTYINIMDQYYPCYQAYKYKELSRRLDYQEYQEVLEYAKKLGFYRGF